MRTTRTPVMLALASLLALLIALVPLGTVASASSAFDQAYKTTNKLSVGDANCSFQTDITDIWSSYITDETLWGTENTSMTQQVKQAFLDAQQNGDVSVSQTSWQQTSTQVGKGVTVYFSEAKTSYLDWSFGVGVAIRGNQYSLTIGCHVGIETSHPTASLTATPSSNSMGLLTYSAGSTTITNFFTTAAQNLPSGYEGVPVATQEPARLKYVAMGDSFSAGEGVEPFETGTEAGCHRSSQAYPRLLSADPAIPLHLTSDGFIACSGAVSDAIKDGTDAQMNKVTTDTDIITMTIGGNDMPVRTYITACIAGSCSGNATDEAIAGIANNVIPEVRDALEALDSHMNTVGSDAAVLVLGYPQIVSETGTAAAQGCWWYDTAEAAAMHNVTQQLNTAIKNEVDAMGSNFHFVSATDSTSPFAEHDLCRADGGSYFINYNPLEPEEYTFHPNTAGQHAYATLVKDWMAQHALS